MADPIRVDISFDLGAKGGKQYFPTLEEFEIWAAKERKIWQWIQDNTSRDSAFSSAWNQQCSGWNEIQDRIQRVRNSPPKSEEQKQRVQQLIDWVSDLYLRKNVVHSSTTRAKFLDELRKSDPLLAAHALNYFLGSALNAPSKIIEGVTLALWHDYGVHDAAKAEKSVLDEMRLQLQAEGSKAKQEFADFKDSYRAFRAANNDEMAAQKNEFQAIVAAAQKSFSTLIEQSQATLKNIERTYDEKLALHASVKYWESKATSHRWFAIAYSISVLLAFIAVGEALYKTMSLVVGNAKFSETELWKLGLIAIIATVGVWMIRVLVRLLLSNLHLYTDSSERKTMMQTYLALLRKGHIPDGDERKLILQVLFRPSSTGIVKDDATPPFMAEWLKRITGHD